MFDRGVAGPAIAASFRKLDPAVQWRNPVMFVVYIGSILTTILWLRAVTGAGEAPAWFIGLVAIWLWFTVLFANFAEGARGRAQQGAGRRAARPATGPCSPRSWSRSTTARGIRAFARMTCDAPISFSVEAGDYIPVDGRSRAQAPPRSMKSAITGESAPVIPRVRRRSFVRHRRNARAARTGSS